MAIEIQIRRDTAANWTSVDPTLAEGEFGLETDTNQLKIGDGVLAWTALAYFGGGGNPFDQDLNTTDPVVFAGLTNNSIIYPTVDGTIGQVIVTDGAGNLSFASAANPFDQDLNTTDPVIFDKVTLTGPIIETQTAVSSSAGMVLLDCNLGNVFTLDLTENIITLNITNIPTSGLAIGITLILNGDGTQRTITWPASFVWAGGVAPTITATLNEKSVIIFTTYDAGATFLAFVAGTSSASGTVTSVTGTSPIVSSGGTTPAISIPAATNASAGYATAAHIAAIEANTAKVTNATHTGDATGSTVLTVVKINGVLMSGLATGILKNTTSTGIPSIATAGTDYIAPSGALGTPSSGTLTLCTGLPISTGVSGLGTNVASFLATPSSANLAAALSDETGTGANVFATSPSILTPTITGLKETKTAPTISSGTLTLNCSLGNVFHVLLNADITTLTISNIPASGTAYALTLAFTADGTTRSVAWPASVKWIDGISPNLTITNGQVDIFVLTTWDGGSTFYAMIGGQNF